MHGRPPRGGPLSAMSLGNSYTYRNELSRMVEAFSRAAKGVPPLQTWRIAPGGGFILGSSNSIIPTTPPENVLAMFEAADR